MRKETILNVFPGADDRHRLVVAVEQVGDASSTLVLRQETHSDDVGWFVQSRVAVESGQVAGLRMALGSGQARASQPAARDARPLPAILRFESAVAHQAG